ncbi:MAG: aspartate/tyrosine/aromatic aminotransferase [Gemmatimonadetes bacterium]|nr:aspartate/tyrosine/aromatic aminotransferase [Gemmatimonadota bacterium]MXY84758.1 aspartate/tyrosine/aromatic aminotransferase [Gemmatimonadota bacterium]MYB67445.1 aspartate/tyrosine/aromatic aminotransferase [Gemmatimonadota bacterium]
MFQQLEMAPADPIMGLSAAFKSNENPNKINLSVGVYQDASGQTPVLASVQTAQERVLAAEKTKSYLSIEGSAEYGAAVRELILGVHEAAERAITVQSPGGTGALRLAGDFLAQSLGDRPVWISEPTWANHPKIFASAGLQVETYPYFDGGTNSIDADALLAALGQIPSGHVVLLHGCCHNPTGCDPTPDIWQQIAEVVAERGLLPLVDFAYQGFGDGLDEDATGLRAICNTGCELLVASSFSKNFGLYNERVGALTLIGADADAAERALSHLKIAARTSYSNPPAHGAAMVREILGDAVLRRQWEGELAQMRERINRVRQRLVARLSEQGVERDFSFIERQRGMFSFSGLNAEQVEVLREQYAIYIVAGGRINVAGLTEDNLDYFCSSVAAVL